MILNVIIFTRPVDTPNEPTGYRVGIFAPENLETPLAQKDFPESAVTAHVEPGQAKIDLTEWGNENPVPEGTYKFRVKSLYAPEGAESPWGAETVAFALTNLEPPNAVSVN